ncbi:MAG: glycerol-3-phosphate 1-O-acyltransferase PlsY [Dehalococcoidia bacterium]|nr:glycerol-3-phosphate 1-O-acyltransferase PlsY [Dehalococcoidia bacterium]
MIAEFVIIVVVAYLLGSIPFGLIISKLKGGVDVRQHGSGKTGATNVMRTAGTKLGFLTMGLDVVKATVAVMLATVILRGSGGLVSVAGVSIHWQQIGQVVAGMAAVIGHNWPVFAKFKGGRGVTAYFGTLFAIYPPAGIFGAQVVAIAALRSRHMSLGSILGASAALCLMIPLAILYNFPVIYLAYSLAVVALLIVQHQDNIKRLRQGTERRLW